MIRYARVLLVGVTAAAIAGSVPATGLANTGGVPHSTKPCLTQSHSGKHKGATHGKKKGALNGKKCGLR
jgi:hypothetical protein